MTELRGSDSVGCEQTCLLLGKPYARTHTRTQRGFELCRPNDVRTFVNLLNRLDQLHLRRSRSPAVGNPSTRGAGRLKCGYSRFPLCGRSVPLTPHWSGVDCVWVCAHTRTHLYVHACKLHSASKSVSAGLESTDSARYLKAPTGMPCSTVLLWTCFADVAFFTNWRRDPPPAKRLRLTLLQCRFITVVWTTTCNISEVYLQCVLSIFFLGL